MRQKYNPKPIDPIVIPNNNIPQLEISKIPIKGIIPVAPSPILTNPVKITCHYKKMNLIIQKPKYYF